MLNEVSIIVPIYNSEKYLEECINSILCQEYKNFELILVNDGSIDNSLDICNKYALEDKRIKIINSEHQGVSNARNLGIQNALGKYICFIDSDDKIHTKFLKTMIEMKDKYKADIVEVDFEYYYGNEKNKKQLILKEKIYTSKQMMKRLYSKDGVRTVIIPNKLYNAKLFKKIKFEKAQNEDEFIIHKLIFETKNAIAVSNQKLYYYRIHKQSRQRTFCKEKIKLLEVFDEREKYFKADKELLKKNKIAKINMIIYLYSICKINNQENEKNYLKEKFVNEYSKIDFKVDIKRKIKYDIFIRNPELISYLCILKRRKII